MEKYVIFDFNKGIGDASKALIDNFREDFEKYYYSELEKFPFASEEYFLQYAEDWMNLHMSEAARWLSLSYLATFKAAGYINLPEHVKYVQEVLDGTRVFHLDDDELADVFRYLEDVWEKTGDKKLAKWVGPDADSEFEETGETYYKAGVMCV